MQARQPLERHPHPTEDTYSAWYRGNFRVAVPAMLNIIFTLFSTPIFTEATTNLTSKE